MNAFEALKTWVIVENYSNLPPPRNCDYKFLKKLLCLFQSSQKNSATRPFFFSMYIFTYIIPWDAGRCIVIFFTFETLTYLNLFRVHLNLESFNCGFRASISILFRAMGVSNLEKFPLFNFDRSSPNSFCVKLGFSEKIQLLSSRPGLPLRLTNDLVLMPRFLWLWLRFFDKLF